jgi:hypothetical protein
MLLLEHGRPMGSQETSCRINVVIKKMLHFVFTHNRQHCQSYVHHTKL